jgi:predicted lipid-binding transport protein (Tim44 family)
MMSLVMQSLAKASGEAMPASFSPADSGSVFFVLQTVILQAVTIAMWELMKAVVAVVQSLKKRWFSETVEQPSEAKAKPNQPRVPAAQPSEAAAQPSAKVFVGESDKSMCWHNSASCNGLNFAGKVRELRHCSHCKRIAGKAQ